MKALPDIVVEPKNEVNQKALEFARAWYLKGSMDKSELRFKIEDIPELPMSTAEVYVMITVRRKTSDQRGYVLAGTIKE
jgi:hypothetical protein